MATHKLTVSKFDKDHFFLLDENEKDPLKSNGYHTASQALTAGKKAFKVGGKFSGKLIKKVSPTTSGLGGLTITTAD